MSQESHDTVDLPVADGSQGEPHPLDNTATMLALLYRWADAGWLRDVDVAFAEQLHRRAPGAPLAVLGAALVSHQSGRGHLLLDLAEACATPTGVTGYRELPEGESPLAPGEVIRVPADVWQGVLAGWEAVGHGPGSEPLVLEGHHLYLRRYWRHERAITQQVDQRLAAIDSASPEALRPLLDGLFPPGSYPADGADWQKIACALAARSPFAVITGGPGTGKTTTVIKLLALLQAQALQSGGQPLRIRLAAPTGKAAARLNESIAGQVDSLNFAGLDQGEAVQAAIPREVSTLHRLLGARPDTRKFRHHQLNPLPLDIVVVDEASMIAIDMMAAILEALPPTARLILLGDKDQLASVEAGAVLGNLCAQAAQGHYLPDTQEWLKVACGEDPGAALVASDGRWLDQAIAMLRHSFRFGDDSGIGHLARAINDGDARHAFRVLGDERFEDIHYQPLSSSADTQLDRLVQAGRGSADAPGYAHYLDVLRAYRPRGMAPGPEWDAWAHEVLRAHGAFQVLSPVRVGPLGVAALNQRIEQELTKAALITPPEYAGHWYEGRPVLVTGNDYGLKLMNGDIGITLAVPNTPEDPDSGTTLRVAFPAGDGQGGVRWVLPSRLQRCETVYAMTVHKSQGSEFTHAALVMPDSLSPILTRELIYTAVTRARKAFTLFTSERGIVEQAIHQRIARASNMFA